MKRLIILSIASCVFAVKAFAQDDLASIRTGMRASDAVILKVTESGTSQKLVEGATVLLPNGSNELDVLVNIPYGETDSIYSAGLASGPVSGASQLKMNIDPSQIQGLLTSCRTIAAHAVLTLNGISKTVTVNYMPVVSGTEQAGNFNIYMEVQFNLADFTPGAGNNTRYVVIINNAKVNRI